MDAFKTSYPWESHACATCGQPCYRKARTCRACFLQRSKAAPRVDELDQATLMRLVAYDCASGVFTWLTSAPNGCRIAGSVAGGRPNGEGYIHIRVGGREYRAHRLAWLYVHGEWPTDQIDHINGDRADNRIVNLRIVNHQQNQANKRALKPNKSSRFRGVHRIGNKWRAHIRLNQKTKHLGTFEREEDAAEAYLVAARAAFGEYFVDGGTDAKR